MKKTRKYIHVVVTRHDESEFEHPLMMAEMRYLKKLINENMFVKCSIGEVSREVYESMFGV